MSNYQLELPCELVTPTIITEVEITKLISMNEFARAIITMTIMAGNENEEEYSCIYIDKPVVFEVTIPKDQVLRFSVKCLDKTGTRIYTARNILTLNLTSPVELSDPIKIVKTNKCNKKCCIL